MKMNDFCCSKIVRAGFVIVLVVAGVATVSARSTSLEFSGDRTSIVLARGRERTMLTGNARIASDSTIVTADEIELYGTDFRYAVASGSVTVVDTKNDLRVTAQKLFYDREAEIMRAEGNAVMEDFANETVVKGGMIENRDEDGITIVQIGVRIFRENLTARSEFARYRRRENIVELSGLPVVLYRGDEYRATRIVIDIDRDEVALQGEVRGTITTQDE
ncbi:MAG: organic solvent tolerance protein OstA [Spirochaetaceae bacterium]|nr:MAG: organic solvent tolerance protein OstA [Spirochaetaceae bacterium]